MAESSDAPPPSYADLFPDRPPGMVSPSPCLVTGQPDTTFSPQPCPDTGMCGATTQEQIQLPLKISIQGEVRGVAVSSETLFVHTFTPPTIRRYDLAGHPLPAYGTGAGSMMLTSYADEYNACICVADGGTLTRTYPDGTLLPVKCDRHLPLEGDWNMVSMATLHHQGRNDRYVMVDGTKGHIVKVDPNLGNIIRVFENVTKDKLQAQHVATSKHFKNKVAITGLNSDLIWLYNKSGNLYGTIGCHGYGDDSLKSPAGLCVDEECNIWVCDHGNGRVVRFVNVAKDRWEGKCVITPEMLDRKRPCHVNVSESGHVIVSVQSEIDNVLLFKFK